MLIEALCRRVSRPRAQAILSWGIRLAMIGENSLIAMQSLRGVRSHMNYTTPFDGTVFGFMGVFILVNTVLAGVLLVLHLFSRTGLPRPLTLGVQLGLFALLAGSAEGL